MNSQILKRSYHSFTKLALVEIHNVQNSSIPCTGSFSGLIPCYSAVCAFGLLPQVFLFSGFPPASKTSIMFSHQKTYPGYWGATIIHYSLIITIHTLQLNFLFAY